MNRIHTLAAGALGALALTAASAAPAMAQSRYDNDDDRLRDTAIGAVVGGLAGALLGGGDERYVLGGVAAGAAIGYAQADDGSDDRRRYDDRRYGHDYRYDDRRYQNRYREGQWYNGQYYRDGRFWRNENEWRRHERRDRRNGRRW